MMRRLGMSGPLRHPNFRLLISGELVSNLGDWLDFLALAVLIAYTWHKGPASLAAVPIVMAIPWVAVAPLAGVLADRWPKRRTMVAADLGRAAVVVGYVFTHSLVVLLVLIAVKTTFSTFFAPSESATVRATVPEEDLHAAISLSQLVGQSTKVIGPALGGLLVGVAGPRAAFVVDAATFVVSAAFHRPAGRDAIERAIRQAPPDGGEAAVGTAEAKPGFWRELREGLAYVASRRALRTSLIGWGFALFLIFGFDSLSALAFRDLGVQRSLYGIAIAGIGLGGAVGTLVVARFAARVNPFVLMGGGMGIVGGLVLLMGAALLGNLGAPAIVWTPVLIAIGLASSGILIASPTIIQRETPLHLMGRVTSTATSLPTVCQLLAPIVSAAIARWQSVGLVFGVEGAGLAVLGLVLAALRPPVGVDVPRGARAPEVDPGFDRAGAPDNLASVPLD